MKFESLEIFNFRNFEKIQLHLSPAVNVFLGENGQGKTNLLESIHFLTRGMSFRPGNNENFMRHSEQENRGPSLVRGQIVKNELKNQVEFLLDKSTRKFFLNKKRRNSMELGRSFPSVLFSPESLSAIKEGPEQRRSLVDEFLTSHKRENDQLLKQFKKCLKTRNRLFKTHLAGEIETIEFEKILQSLNPSFFMFSTHLVLARTQALRALLPKMQEAMRFILQEQNVDISVDYLISGQSALDWSQEEVFSQMISREKELAAAERSSGLSLVGPHKHDIQFLMNGKDSRYYSSQGQQRALILSYKMAQIVYHQSVSGDYPILLLDDVMSELDTAKRERLVQLLKGIEAQIFITTTDFELSRVLSDRQLSVFQIEKGSVKKSLE